MHLSLVIPVYNEARSLALLLDTCSREAERIPRSTWEFVFVNDGSRDASLSVLCDLVRRDPRVRVVDLSRNYGKEVALSAGLEHARGDAAIFMDADLQHPPTLLPPMVEAWRSGADVVVAVRVETEAKTLLRRVGSFAYHRLMKRFSDHVTEAGSTDFRLLDRSVCDAMKLVTERGRLFRGLVDWLGFRRVVLPFSAGARHAGAPTYSLRRLWDLAIQAFVSHSQVPLWFVLYLGMITVALSMSGLAWMYGAEYCIGVRWHYTPLAKALVFNTGLVGVLQVSIGIVGLYVAKIQYEVVGRPLYVVRRTLGAATIPQAMDRALEPVGVSPRDGTT